MSIYMSISAHIHDVIWGLCDGASNVYKEGFNSLDLVEFVFLEVRVLGVFVDVQVVKSS